MPRGEAWLRRKLNMKRSMSPGVFWSEFGVQVISYLCATIVLSIILSVTLPLPTDQLTTVAEYAACGLAVLWCIPIARNTRYRLRDAGYTAKAYLWLLLPVVGWVIFLALLLAKSKLATSDESEQGIDSWYC